MSALHNLVVQGKVLYLVCYSSLLCKPHCLTRIIGNIKHASMDRAQSESIREGAWEDTVLNLPGKVERTRAIVRARHYSDGAF